MGEFSFESLKKTQSQNLGNFVFSLPLVFMNRRGEKQNFHTKGRYPLGSYTSESFGNALMPEKERKKISLFVLKKHKGNMTN